MKRAKCCVIGGAGFIGAHLTNLVVQSGREVVVLGRRSAPDHRLSPSVTYVSGDYADRAILRQVLAGAAEIIDLAYATVPQTSFADPVFDILSNLPASVGLLQEAVATGARRFLFVSSGGTVYGPASALPIAEDHPTDPISPYGITKLTIEKYGRMFHRVAGLPVLIARPANAFGEEQRPFVGQGFIATAVHSILRGEEIVLYGEAGTVRDYLHVSDVARGIFSILENGRPGEAYNIGSGAGRSNLQVLETLSRHAKEDGRALRIKRLPPRTFDVPANVLDSSKLHAASGWRPLVGFDEGIERTWRAASNAYSHAG